MSALLLLGAAAATVGWLAHRDSSQPESPSTADGSTLAGSGTTSRSGERTAGGDSQVELQDLRLWRSAKSPSTIHLVGVLVNAGAGTIDKPQAKVTFHDAAGTELDTSDCSALLVYNLEPGDKVPCSGMTTKATGYKTTKVRATAANASGDRRRADLKITEVTTAPPRSRFSPFTATGTVTNHSSFKAKSVWVYVGLYDTAGKIAGSRRALVAGNELEPGASARFEVKFYEVATTDIKTALTQAFGYDR